MDDLKGDRKQIAALFRQVIKNVVIDKVDDNTATATVFIHPIPNLTPKDGYKFFIDLSGLRKRPVLYRYGGFTKDGNKVWKIIPNEEILTVQ